MSVMVLGREGQLGRALSEGAEDSWRFLDRDEADLAIPGAAAEAIREARPDAVVNAAAYTAVDDAESDEAAARRINAGAVAEIAEACASTRAALVHISTDYVFDGSATHPWREDDPTGPLGAYGRTKLAGEVAALGANPRTVILRTAWLFSPWGRNFVLTMLRLAAEQAELRVVDDQHGSPTSALDLARACRRVLSEMAGAAADDPRWGVYHYAGRGETSWAGFAREIVDRAAGRLIRAAPCVRQIGTADFPRSAPRPARSVLNSTKFTEVFGLAPATWQAALAETLDRIEQERAA